MITATKEAQQITPELWLVSIYLNEPEKSTNACQFVCTRSQMAFLEIMTQGINNRGQSQ